MGREWLYAAGFFGIACVVCVICVLIWIFGRKDTMETVYFGIGAIVSFVLTSICMNVCSKDRDCNGSVSNAERDTDYETGRSMWDR